MQDDRLYARLAYAGALPFALCMVLAWTDSLRIPGLEEPAAVAAGYGLAIAAFMAGVHWGTYLYLGNRTPLNLLVISNAVTIAAWLGFAFTPVRSSLLTTAAAFTVLLWVDTRLARIRLISDAYMATRRSVTTLVVILLLLTMMAP